MKLFLEPKSVALVGISRRTGKGSFNILESLINYGFGGEIYPVNPNAHQILGIKVYPSVNDLPAPVDVAVISTPRSHVLNAIRDCADKGIKAIIINSQGFADADEEGRALQEEIVRIARRNGARILGPNTLGVFNAFNRFTSNYLVLAKNEKAPVGVICQTGFFLGFSNFGLIGKGVDLGNACDVDFADVLEYLEDDPDIRLIVLHIDGIKKGREFFEMAKRVSTKKPILALKGGRSEQGARAAASHTGSLAGNDSIYDAVFKQAGIIRARGVDELEDLTKAFLNLPLINGKRVAIVTPTGGVGILASDACKEHNLELAKLSQGTLKRVKDLSPQWTTVGNPVDIWLASMTHGYKKVFKIALEAVLNDGNVDAVLCITPSYGMIPEYDFMDASEVIKRTVTTFKDKPVVLCIYGPCTREMASNLEETGNTVAYTDPKRALRVLSILGDYSKYLEKVKKSG